MLATLVARHAGTARGLELADGRRVEADRALGFDSDEAPEVGEKALVVVAESGNALRWEPYAATCLRRRGD